MAGNGWRHDGALLSNAADAQPVPQAWEATPRHGPLECVRTRLARVRARRCKIHIQGVTVFADPEQECGQETIRKWPDAACVARMVDVRMHELVARGVGKAA